jgi:hypothetical protein
LLWQYLSVVPAQQPLLVIGPQLDPDTHWPEALQTAFGGQGPHCPLQPSGPHSLPSHCGLQPGTHFCALSQVKPGLHSPQFPPQPSGPQARLWQAGLQVPTHCQLFVSQLCPDGQLPQVPPHPSGPHCRPVQRGAQPASLTTCCGRSTSGAAAPSARKSGFGTVHAAPAATSATQTALGESPAMGLSSALDHILFSPRTKVLAFREA